MENVRKLEDEVLAAVSKRLENQVDIPDDLVKDTSYDVLRQLYSGQMFSVKRKTEIANYVLNNMKKLGVLQPLLDDKTITEIMINGYENIFVEKQGHVYKTDAHFESRKQLEDTIQRIVSKVNRTVDTANPICDARLQDGSRVNIVLYPIALNGPIVTIRKFSEKALTFDELLAWKAITPEAADFLRAAVRAKYNIIVSGGTGSGKTTFLNTLSQFISPDERIITIEDSAELQINSIKNLVRLETRNANTEGKGSITIRDLIRSSLRMRPERIIVGEVRGAEALDMLQAMNTGHDGSLSTGHANSTHDMLSRLETMVLMGAELPMDAIRQQIASAVDIIVQLGRMSDKTRKTLEIVELLGYDQITKSYNINPIFKYEFDEDSRPDKVKGGLKRTGNPLNNTHKFEMSGIPFDKY